MDHFANAPPVANPIPLDCTSSGCARVTLGMRLGYEPRSSQRVRYNYAPLPYEPNDLNCDGVDGLLYST